MISPISAKFLIGKLPSRCQDQGLRVTLRVVDALQRSNDLVTGDVQHVNCLKNKEMVYQYIHSLSPIDSVSIASVYGIICQYIDIL